MCEDEILAFASIKRLNFADTGTVTFTVLLYLLHRCKVEPKVGEEGQGELHPRVEEQVDEVGQTNLKTQ